MELIDTYKRSKYQIHLMGGTLTIGCDDILGDEHSYLKNSAFITANNPNGIISEDNEKYNRQLLVDICTEYRCTTGIGGDTSHSEDHYLIYDISLADATDIAKKYKQLAFIYIDSTLTVRLQVL